MAGTLTERERVAHVLRRFGLGAGRYEVSRYLAEGAEGAFERLLQDAKEYEDIVDPYLWTVDEEGALKPESYRLASWWALRMVVTRRPLQERLALFWHDHFALDAESVGESPMMLGYLGVLHRGGLGRFRDLLDGVVKQGAMLAYLNNNTSNRIHPNENLGRELLELFTLGRGNYTEEDVRSAARALTGWTLHYLGTGLEVPWEELRDRAAKHRMALMNACFVPGMHDDGDKPFLGKTGPLSTDDLLDRLADHPATAEHLCRKLWVYFATPDPEDRVVARLVEAWTRSKGSVEAVLRQIVETPEFWSERCVGQVPKSPVDWTVSLLRALDLGDVFDPLLTQAELDGRVPPPLRDTGNVTSWLMSLQGLSLLFPPTVGGWTWGEGWLSTQVSVERIKHADHLFWGGGEDRPLAAWLRERIKADGEASDDESVVRAMLAVFDVPAEDGTVAQVTEAFRRNGGLGAFEGDRNALANVLAQTGKAAFALPAFQLL